MNLKRKHYETPVLRVIKGYPYENKALIIVELLALGAMWIWILFDVAEKLCS